MTSPNIVFLHGLNQALVDLVLSTSPAEYKTVAISRKQPEEEQLAALRDADFCIVYRAIPSDNVLRAAKKLRLVQLLAAGYDDMNVPLMHELDIPFANNGGANARAVADQSVLLMLSLYRRLLAGDRDVRAGKWNASIDGLNTYEMDGKVVGVVGLGNIGLQVARRVQAFGATVQYFNRNRLAPEKERELGVKAVSLDEMFTTSDILTLHCPLTPQTSGLVNRDRLATMKRNAIVINTSRGAVVDEVALAEAVATQRIAGAGVDAFEQEPVNQDNPLLGLENVVLSPHGGGTTFDTWRRRGQFAYANIRRVWGGGQPESLVLL
jgi:phosphoglycerate dehydrogenase-like enzyme